ncbi:MAG: shikimate kinase [Propionicimonas sp.]|nr:shikimate kinase [Propionicimonas sp.]
MIVLVGFMGAGKTTIGRALASRLGRPFVDTDQVVEAGIGLSIADIFEGFGERGFREIEARVIAEQLAGPEAVVALGGGAVTTPAVREALAGHDVVLLDITLEDALSRVGGDPSRPMLHRPDLADVFASRADTYRAIATVRVPVGGRPAAEVVELVLAGLEDPTAVPLDPGSPDAGE